MHKILLSTFLIGVFFTAKAQGPSITSWIQNTTVMGTTQGSSNNILTNCQAVYYDANNVYIKSTSMPGYDIGPWQANPNTPSNQNKTWKIPQVPIENTGTKTKTGLGAIGIWINGVEVFNQKDGQYWNGTNFVQGAGANWNRNALYYEGVSFDACLGHPAPGGAYHLHVNPTCLYDDNNTQVHSPIVGYAHDGFPIYGAYGYTNTNGTGPIKRMASSYVLNNTRTGTPTPPPVNATYPLGCLCEDYTYSAGAGDLDKYNGRFCITPEYPAGMYAYFITIDASGNPAYPFILGNEYYGNVAPGAAQGNNNIPVGATQYIQAPNGLNNASVRLDNLNVTKVGSNVKIDWVTSYENELNYFVVQRSKNGSIWEDLTQFPASNTDRFKQYEAIDYTPFNGISYYRIKVVDLNYKESFSDIRRIDLDNLFEDVRAYPNPFNNQISLTTDGSLYTYKLINFMGQTMMSGSVKGSANISTEKLLDGIYLLELTNPVTDITKSSKVYKSK